MATTTGMDLRVERVRASVSVKNLAARMGLTRATVHKYEGRALVQPDVAAAYRRALASITAEREAAA